MDIDELITKRAARQPSGRLGDAFDTANAALFLASNEAKHVTGTTLTVDGGQSAFIAVAIVEGADGGGAESDDHDRRPPGSHVHRARQLAAARCSVSTTTSASRRHGSPVRRRSSSITGRTARRPPTSTRSTSSRSSSATPGARYQRHQIPAVELHYADAFVTYGPFSAGAERMRFFTLRPCQGQFKGEMPSERNKLRYQGRRGIHVDVGAHLAMSRATANRRLSS